MTLETITDTHCHIIDRGTLDYPWLGDVPALDRDWTVAEYTAEARKAGIGRTLHMEVDVAENRIADETAHVADLAAAGGSLIVGAIAACRPEHDGFAAEIEAALERPFVRGFRRVLHVVPDDVSRSDAFRANIRRLAAVDLPFDLCVLARQLPLAAELVDAAPETRFVLDHCGVPDIAAGGWDVWAAGVTGMARRENVSAKISGLPAYAAEGHGAQDLERWVMHVVEAFGPGRLVWGGDWPVCTLGGSLSSWVAGTRAILAQLGAAERAAIYNDNATRIWRL